MRTMIVLLCLCESFLAMSLAQGPAAGHSVRQGTSVSLPTVNLLEELQIKGPDAIFSATSGMNFGGLGEAQSGNFSKPDPTVAVGSGYVVQVVNKEYEAWSKVSGAVYIAPTQLSTIWQGLGSGNFAQVLVPMLR